MPSYNAAPQSHNVLSFQTKQEYCPREHYQTSSERDVYSAMYVQTRNGTESRRFTLDGLKFATGIKSQNTVRVALAGLVRKGHVTVLDKKGSRHYGILYRVQMPHEIRALNQDPTYLAEQMRLAEEVKRQKAKAKQPKPKQEKLDFDKPHEPTDPPDQPTDEVEESQAGTVCQPVPTAAPVAAVAPLAALPETSEIEVTESAKPQENDEVKNSKIEVTETQKLRSQKARILLLYLTCITNMENLGGVSGIPMCACMREAESGHTETPSVAAPEPPVSAQPVPPPAKSEGDKADGMPRATVSPENTDLGKAILVILQWTDIVLDQRLKAEFRRAYAFFRANHATPEDILRYKVWWWESGRIRPPKVDWLIENFPVFRGEIAPPEATGTGGQNSQPQISLKAKYEQCETQMYKMYVGHQWESLSEKFSVLKRFVLNANLHWDDDLANEVLMEG